MKYSESLKKNRDFQNVYKNGKSMGNKYLVMYILELFLLCCKLCLVLVKKIVNSCSRSEKLAYSKVVVESVDDVSNVLAHTYL